MGNIRILSLCAALVVLGGCASTPSKSLDLTALTAKTFVLNEVSMMVRKDIDKDGSGAKFVKAQHDGLFKAIQSAALAKGVEVDVSAFSSAVANDSLVMKKDDIDVSADFQLYWYHWTVDSAAEQTAAINVTMAQTPQGIPATVSFSKADPAAPQKPFSSSVDIHLHVTTN